MAVFVILSLALLTMSLGLVLVAARHLIGSAKRLGGAAARAQEHAEPLTREIQQEVAVAGMESERISRRLQAWREERGQRHRTAPRA